MTRSSLFAVPLVVLLAPLLNACGEGTSSKSAVARKASATAAVSSSANSGTSSGLVKDRDRDYDMNDDDAYVLGFGHAAGTADDRAITALIRRYFAAAADGEGRAACSLLTPFVAEAVVENVGRTPALKGKTCPSVMSKLFGLSHAELLGKRARLRIVRVGVQGDSARVALEFPEIPTIRQLRMRRQAGRWTVLDLLDHLIE